MTSPHFPAVQLSSVAWFSGFVSAAEEAPRHGSLSTEPAAKWQQGFISGNGELQEWALNGAANTSDHGPLPHLYAHFQSDEADQERTPGVWVASAMPYKARLNDGESFSATQQTIEMRELRMGTSIKATLPASKPLALTFATP